MACWCDFLYQTLLLTEGLFAAHYSIVDESVSFGFFLQSCEA